MRPVFVLLFRINLITSRLKFLPPKYRRRLRRADRKILDWYFNLMEKEWQQQEDQSPEGENLLQQHRFDQLMDHIQRDRLKKLSQPGITVSWKIAASVAVIFAFGFLAFRYLQHREDSTIRLSWRYVNAGNNANRKVTLPDGSDIWLNSGSILRFPEEFRDTIREVFLTGEAYFEVAHRDKHPFIIRSNGVSTKVLGTKFNVKAYPSFENVVVSVLSGKVGVSRKNSAGLSPVVLLEASQQVVYSRKTDQMETFFLPDVTEQLAWRNGKLIFRNTPLPEVLSLLQNKYGITIRAGKQFESCQVYFEFGDEPVDDVLLIIEKLVQGKIKKDANGYQLTGPGCR